MHLPESRSHQSQILVVEDDKTYARMVTKAFERAGCGSPIHTRIAPAEMDPVFIPHRAHKPAPPPWPLQHKASK